QLSLQVEAKIFELREAMVDRGFVDEEIEAKVKEVRKELMEREMAGQKASLVGRGAGGATGSGMDTHLTAARKVEANRRMRDAFGLGDDYAEGEAFDEEAQAQKKQARQK
ncbi:unnamed protein product, partial [Choristocarpus tenellus]